jgi:hypothetical protein
VKQKVARTESLASVTKDPWGSDSREMQALDDVMEASVTSAQDDLSRAQWQFTHSNSWGRKGEVECWGVCNHTDTTGSHVGSNHDGALARLELVQDPIALVLLLVTVNGW